MSIQTFNSKAPGIMHKLRSDFSLDAESAAAILGNLGAESGGLSSLQEINPTVAGSRGGYGWAQWTGPRRRAYEAYCARNRLNPASDQANYAYLFVELSQEYKSAISAVKAAQGLRNKVIAFERTYEKAGVKNYSSRESWAKRALAAYKASPISSTVVVPKATPQETAVKTTGWLGLLAASWAALVTFGQTHPWLTGIGIGAAIMIALSIHARHDVKKEKELNEHVV